MPRSRNQQDYAALSEQIKSAARAQMAAEGAAALSLRGIARSLDMTAPALYHYFSTRSDLITALIVDAFTGLAEALEAADQMQSPAAYHARLTAVLVQYRRWALAHPIDFALIYGTPIPGYEAPREVTVPAAQRGNRVAVGILAAAHQAGKLTLPATMMNGLPPPVAAHLTLLSERDAYHVDPLVLYLAAVGWARIHGVIMLELFGHLQPAVGSSDAFYAQVIDDLLCDMGLSPPGPLSR